MEVEDEMSERNETVNKFEFVLVAGARARQLQQGCTPRTQGSDKPVRLAQLEVREGKVAKVPETR
jgi:DNA-directed RNA polymerase subunit K/omega